MTSEKICYQIINVSHTDVFISIYSSTVPASGLRKSVTPRFLILKGYTDVFPANYFPQTISKHKTHVVFIHIDADMSPTYVAQRMQTLNF